MPSWKKIIVSGSDAQLNSVNVGTGTYNTGLFDTYTSATTVGTAVGDFNNILKALAPAQAPAYSTLGATGSVGQASSVSPTFVGVSGLTYISKPYLSGSGIIANNTAFQKYSDTTSRNYLGAISASRAFSGFRITTNPATTANASTYTNYPNGAFVAQSGTTEETWTLKLNGSQLDSFTVRDANASSSINANFGTFTVGPYKSAQFITTGDNVTNYGSRSGSFTFTIPATEANLAWNPGLNNFEVTRSVGGTEYKSNTYWIWDPGVDVTVTSTSNTLSTSGIGSGFIGGFTYFTGSTSPTITVAGTINNFYKYNYGTVGSTAATIGIVGLSNQLITISAPSTHADTITVNTVFNLTKTSRYSPSDTYSSTIAVTPIIRSSVTSNVSATTNKVLYDNSSAITSTLITNRVKNTATTAFIDSSAGTLISTNKFSTYTVSDISTIVTAKEPVYYNGAIYGAKNTTLNDIFTNISSNTLLPSSNNNSNYSSGNVASWRGQSTYDYAQFATRTSAGQTQNVTVVLVGTGLTSTATVKYIFRNYTTGAVTEESDTVSIGATGLTINKTLIGKVDQNKDIIVLIQNIISTGVITSLSITV